jgi:hypothetical protein
MSKPARIKISIIATPAIRPANNPSIAASPAFLDLAENGWTFIIQRSLLVLLTPV